ncbi:putative phosphatase regulatory subunit-domain-containing protein [Fusarium oxysporum]|nr:putative phosphatase regulatory subunit-domain-containing protein [Fusarium oxysporum]
MPYTPPSNRSPASSASASPVASRRLSLQSSSRLSLPRSASYLHKHRRTPSAVAFSDGSTGTLTPQGTSEDLKSMGTAVHLNAPQSPPPLTDDRTMPMGAIISPSNSVSSGSDEEQKPQIRDRKLDKALRNAISQIPLPRSSSPERSQPHKQDSGEHPQLRRKDGVQLSFSTSALDDLAKGRKIGHVRSATEPNAGGTKSADNSVSVSEEETDEVLLKKPQMVRKKSGELVRPALRPSSRRHPSSMPGTPVFSKSVHFDSHLEHVRHFLQVDQPLAVSAGSSPIGSYESDTDGRLSPQTSPTTLPLASRYLDQKNLLGSVAVANIAFQKAVTCRFTLDYWETTSEVAADYSHEIRPREMPLGHDRFTFSIKLADTANLESKTLFLCVRYTVNGQDYWDNNNLSNFQVHFRKKHLSQNRKGNFQGASSRPANSLPQSNRHTRSSSVPHSKSIPSDFSEFGENAKFSFDQPSQEYLGESGSGNGGLRLKSKSTGSLASDNLSKDFGSPSGRAFSNRCDFGASFNGAVQAAKDKETSPQDKDGLYMKANVRNAKPTLTVPEPTNDAKSQMTALRATSPNLTISRSIYEELFGSKQSSPNIKDGKLSGARFGGSVGNNPIRRAHITSLGNPNGHSYHAGPAACHTLHLHGLFSPPSAASTSKDAFRPSSTLPIPRPTATIGFLGLAMDMQPRRSEDRIKSATVQ